MQQVSGHWPSWFVRPTDRFDGRACSAFTPKTTPPNKKDNQEMYVTDQEKQGMINKMVAGELCIQKLSEDEFYGLLAGLMRMYSARVWNCCDASGKMDHEWSSLSDIFQRLCEERGAETARAEKVADQKIKQPQNEAHGA